MRRTKPRKIWVFGLFSGEKEARDFIGTGLARGFNTRDFALYLPHGIPRKFFKGIKIYPRHPEFRWILEGLMFGATMGILVGMYSLKNYPSYLEFTNIVVLMGYAFAGAIFGGMYSILYFDTDTLLHAYYAEKGGNKILAAIGLNADSTDQMEKARRLFAEQKVFMQKLPDVKTASHLISEVVPQHSSKH